MLLLRTPLFARSCSRRFSSSSSLPSREWLLNITETSSSIKAMAQNFIHDENMTAKIVRRCVDSLPVEAGGSDSEGQSIPSCDVIEIGPGYGCLTLAALKNDRVRYVAAVEIDSRFVPALDTIRNSTDMFNYVNGDALEFSLQTICDELLPFTRNRIPVAVIANLPFNIATPLIFKWIDELEAMRQQEPTQQLQMPSLFGLNVQYEVGERICAPTHSKPYGKLSVMCQTYFDCRQLFKIPAKCFVPVPKVDGCVVQLIPKQVQMTSSLSTLQAVTSGLFTQRRKMLRKTIEGIGLTIDDLLELNIDPTLRPQNLTLTQLHALAQRVDETQLVTKIH